MTFGHLVVWPIVTGPIFPASPDVTPKFTESGSELLRDRHDRLHCRYCSSVCLSVCPVLACRTTERETKIGVNAFRGKSNRCADL